MSLSRQSKDALCDVEGALSQRTSVSNNLELKNCNFLVLDANLHSCYILPLPSSRTLTTMPCCIKLTFMSRQIEKTCAWDLIGGHIHTSSRWFVQPEQAWCIFTADGASHRDTHCLCGTCLAPSSTWLLWRSVLWPEAYGSLSSGFDIWESVERDLILWYCPGPINTPPYFSKS